jgi:uncharacterized membrane protein
MTMRRRKLVVFIAMNATAVIYCLYFYFHGYSLGRVALVFVVSATIVNLVAEFSWRSAIKRNQANGKSL